jgi:hypothetical protein
MRTGVVIFIFLSLLGCQNHSKPPYSFQLLNLENKITELNFQPHTMAMVFIFLVPDCPFSQYYVMAINQVYSNFSQQGFQFYGIVPGKLYLKSEIDSFKNHFNFIPEIYMDPLYKLSNTYHVKVVPTVLVISPKGEVLYQGKVDNQAIQAGQKRYQATQYYLLDALKSIAQKKEIRIKSTKAVGCFIE